MFCHTFRQYGVSCLTSLKTNNENYSNTFYLVTLSKEINCGSKEWETKECKSNHKKKKKKNMRSREMQGCS